MRLPFKSSHRAEAAAVGDDEVSRARTQARRRLVGAFVLLVAGVIGFPMLFETQPRPLPVDTPIITPARNGSIAAAPAPRAAPARSTVVPPPPPPPPDAGNEEPVAGVAGAVAAPAAASAASMPTPTARASAPAPRNPMVAAAGGASASGSVTVAAASAPVRRSPASAPPPGAAARPAGPPSVPATVASWPAAAPHAAETGRFVVQVGAYTDAATLRETRGKVEKLGLKTYTQVIENDASRRTRVRVGPFATRAEAQAAAARLKAAGLPGNLLAL